MIKVMIMSQAQAVAASKTLTEKTAIVSITVPEQKLPVFAENKNILGIFRMQFWDISSPMSGIEMPKQSDFDGLKDFVDRMVSAHVKIFLVHCAAGISRSSATAAAISDYLSLGAHIFDNPAYFPNRLVYRLARHELGLSDDKAVPEEGALLKEYDRRHSGTEKEKHAGGRVRRVFSKLVSAFFRKKDAASERAGAAADDSGYAKDPAGTVRKVWKLAHDGKTVEEIAGKCHISASLAEKIVRLVLTHPEGGAEDIMEKMGIR